GTISIDLSNMKDGDVAGIGAYNGEPGLISVIKRKRRKYLIMTDRDKEKERVELQEDKVYLRMDCDFNINVDKAKFYYSLDEKEWIQLGPEFQMVYYTDHFMGIRFAIYNYATKASGGYVDVDFFEYNRK
ncbi:glycoside hydrolase, partial [Bacteroides sp. OttesenSCG-928-E20]|nr:glycoside hydrolase [Bacteroides sp. OttesenSCG-928-N06]MDL2299985.1 glycoside hydrolase [Bacteroides sp. OttesenSCG-928-E20]